jgi:prepilin-type N-terminal cleavage/methylation domain-containing protein
MTRRGFTLLEVMLALALVGVGLTVLIKSVASNMFAAQEAQMTGIVTDLSRAKMYDVEERLLKDGFMDTDQSDAGNFEDQGWPTITWAAKVEQVELPSWDELQALAKGHAMAQMGSAATAGKFGAGLTGPNAGSALASSIGASVADQLGSAFGSSMLPTDFSQLGSDALSTFQNSALGGMLSQFGGGFGLGGMGGSDALSGAGALVIQSQYTMVQNVLKVSIRKVTLKVMYAIAGHDRDLTTVAYFTDAASMDKVLNGLGSQDIGDGSGSGGSGAGSAGSAATTPTSPTSGNGTRSFGGP